MIGLRMIVATLASIALLFIGLVGAPKDSQPTSSNEKPVKYLFIPTSEVPSNWIIPSDALLVGKWDLEVREHPEATAEQSGNQPIDLLFMKHSEESPKAAVKARFFDGHPQYRLAHDLPEKAVVKFSPVIKPTSAWNRVLPNSMKQMKFQIVSQ